MSHSLSEMMSIINYLRDLQIVGNVFNFLYEFIPLRSMIKVHIHSCLYPAITIVLCNFLHIYDEP